MRVTGSALHRRFRALCAEQLPLSGQGETPARLARLMEIGREDLSLAKLTEAHWDAVGILAEAGREPVAGCAYGVWAAEGPGSTLTMHRNSRGFSISGSKFFCSGSRLLDRSLVTVTEPEQALIDLDLKKNKDAITFDQSFWQTPAFAETETSNAIFLSAKLSQDSIVKEPGWYMSRPGFWHGALGPAACWAGGAAGLVDYAKKQRRKDAHTLAHLGAMEASIWALKSFLSSAGAQIDQDPSDAVQAQVRALKVRHLIEQACTDILRRFARAYGPYPLAANESISRRYMELDLFLRQSHAERDLETLGDRIINISTTSTPT